MLRFEENGGKSRELPARSNLKQVIAAYLDAAGLQQASPALSQQLPASSKVQNIFFSLQSTTYLQKFICPERPHSILVVGKLFL
jgi:hypothetical protein